MYSSNRLARALRRPVVIVSGALLLGACTTWEEQWNPAPGTSRPVGLVRLTRTDGSVMVLEHVVVRGDSIVGRPPRMTAEVAFALADVKKAEVQRADPASTFWAGALGVAAGAFGFLYWAFHSGDY